HTTTFSTTIAAEAVDCGPARTAWRCHRPQESRGSTGQFARLARERLAVLLQRVRTRTHVAPPIETRPQNGTTVPSALPFPLPFVNLPCHRPLKVRQRDRSNRLQCPLLAQSGHALVHCKCPLSGGKQT